MQANALTGPSRVVLCAGQTSADADDLETVLEQARLGLGDVVRLNYYTTDIDAFFAASDVLGQRLATAGCRPASTLLGVASLAFPEFLVEIEATAAA